MTDRPKIKLHHSRVDTLTEITGWLLVIVVWTLTISAYSTLPETIPIHFNGSGHVDGSGNKAMVWTLPIMGTILFTGLTILNDHPHRFNYPVPLTHENASTQYTRATRLIRYLKLVIIVIFTILTNRTIQTATGAGDGLGPWFLPLTLGLIFIPLLGYVASSFLKKK